MATCRSFNPKPSGTSPTPSRQATSPRRSLSFKPQDTQGYGRIVLDADGSLLRIVEQKDCTPEEAAIDECNAGCYAFDGAQLKAHIGEVGCDNAQHEYYLPDMLGILREAGERVASYCCEDYRDGLGVNSRSQLAELTAVARDRINERLMAEGVTFIDPAQAWIGPDATVGRDTVIWPQTHLIGTCVVGEDCVLGLTRASRTCASATAAPWTRRSASTWC